MLFDKKHTMLLIGYLCFLYLCDAKLRARDLGIPFTGTPGPFNSITDVRNVEVGFSTIIEGQSIRTGVTAVFPRGKKQVFQNKPCFANWFSLNGRGEMTNTHWVTESGLLKTPILITNTLSVGTCQQALIKWYLRQDPPVDRRILEEIDLPMVAETYDGYLNDIIGFHVKDEHVFEALDSAEGFGSRVREGNVGGGTGMITLGFKAGTGTSSRFVESLNATVGVLVQSNFGRKKQLIIAGVPVGEELLKLENNRTNVPDEDAGSIIVILATDAPLLPQQLKRLATRVSLGIGKVGGIGADSSGDIFLAFSTTEISQSSTNKLSTEFLLNEQMNSLFEATIEAVEEAIINAMIAAETMIGLNGLRVEAISHEQLIQILKKYNRFNEQSK